MTRIIFCSKLQQDSAGLEKPPFPGPLGEKIFQHISLVAWQQWLNQQTILMNEYRLNLAEQEARQFLQKEMQKFLFGDN
ncbi:MAG: oxidative damage protection protein [Legionellaceae bacterium]|nr:oxidative damage protection protein [Legionellaceae bacterium]